MNTGVDRRTAEPFEGAEQESYAAMGVQQAAEAPWLDLEAPEGEERSSVGRTLLAVALMLLGLGWVGACIYAFIDSAVSPNLPSVLAWVAIVAAPLALLLLAWIAFGRTSRRETQKFSRAVTKMRTEAESLDRVMGIVAEQIATNRAQLSEEAARLMKLGEEASDRLGRVTHYLSREGTDLERRSQGLETAAAQARLDLGVLLTDLPQAELAARTFSETMREAGVSAHERALALEAQMSALAAKAQEADLNTGGAAERLGAHIARIESSAGVAAERLDGVTVRMETAVDQALARATEAVDATRMSLETQAQGLYAAIEQGRARFVDAGAEASRLLTARLAEAQQKVETIEVGIAAQEQATRGLVSSLSSEIENLGTRLDGLGRSGTEQSTQLEQSIASLTALTAALQARLGESDGLAEALIARAGAMAEAADVVGDRFVEALPPVIAEAEAQIRRTQEAAEAAGAPVAALQASAGEAARLLAEAEASTTRQQAALEALLAGIATSVAGIEEQMRTLTAASNEADDAANLIVKDTGPELIEALMRVREAARVASAHAREAISGVIPDSAARLADAARDAVSAAMSDTVRGQIDELEAASQRAATAARKASERVTRQLLTLGESAAALEEKIEEERALRETADQDSLSHRVALLVESLNSTAIDVAKILSNEVTDRAWTAYLKGDRGVFTRRAVRLLETSEVRTIVEHYEAEPEFRDQVNRYIHDFEAMLRRVLADREGEALSVTLLSSDMGKLYVALAQAIERLRR